MLLAVLVEHALDGAVQVADADALAAVSRGRGIELSALLLGQAMRGFVAGGLSQRSHLDGSERGFVSFITALQAGAVDGLLERLARQHAVGVWGAGLLRGLPDAARDLGRDVLVMRGVAADDAAEADDGVVTVRLGELARGEWDLEGAGDADDFDVIVMRARLVQRLDSVSQQALG